MRFDVTGGVVGIATAEGGINPETLTFRSQQSLAARPIVTAGFTSGVAGIDWGWIAPVADEGWTTRIAVRINWPGRLFMY